MRKRIPTLLAIICAIILIGCASSSTPNSPLPTPSTTDAEPSAIPSETDIQKEDMESGTLGKGQEDSTMPSVNIQVGDINFTATMHDNESARAIVNKMPFTLNMTDFGSQEKVADITFDLPSAQTMVPATINVGDIYLWSGNNLVLFYTTFSNSYSYVPVGYIEDVTGLRDALGNASMNITFHIIE